ncbi:MAG TPA: class I adenylate-forming enzyme family protein [Nocardioidaceae bacterium]|nr:class I adenylate-forming enzyme family protein [Nocardioidaceae bacterium]
MEPAGTSPLSALYEPADLDSSALVFGDDEWSYRRLHDVGRALAGHLAPLSGERVAFMLPNCPEAVLLYLACWRSGAVAVPLNLRYAAPELKRVLGRCRPRLLVVHESRLGLLADLPSDVLAPVRVSVVGDPGSSGFEPFSSLAEPAADPAAVPASHADRAAVIFFTSGSTGEPKGVVHTHGSVRGILDSTSEALGNITAGDVLQVSDPLVHISGFMETMTGLVRGAEVVLYDGFDLPTYVAGLRAHRPTLVCTHLDVLAQLSRDRNADADWFSSFRGVYTGGDTVPAAVQRDFSTRFGQSIAVGYGMTEAIWLTVSRTGRLDRDGCIGEPVGGAEIRRHEQTGELLARGPMVMQGYWEDDELTRAMLADGWLHTGDIGSQDTTGTWWYEGRIKDLIVRRTSKITPGEVESAIVLHPAVAAAAVVAADDTEEGQVPVAFVVAKDGESLSAETLTEFLRDRIAAYKLPARVHFVDALPLTASGKIAHRELREPSGYGKPPD